jgi:hypothetical protein
LRSIEVPAADPLVAPRVHAAAGGLGVERDLARGVADRELADHAQPAAAEALDPRAAEPQHGEVLDVEEVGRAQVVVALGRAGVDARGVDRDLDPRPREVAVVELDRAGVLQEPAADLRRHHVADRETGGRVGGVDVQVSSWDVLLAFSVGLFCDGN